MRVSGGGGGGWRGVWEIGRVKHVEPDVVGPDVVGLGKQVARGHLEELGNRVEVIQLQVPAPAEDMADPAVGLADKLGQVGGPFAAAAEAGRDVAAQEVRGGGLSGRLHGALTHSKHLPRQKINRTLVVLIGSVTTS